jgi:hypothetical protein
LQDWAVARGEDVRHWWRQKEASNGGDEIAVDCIAAGRSDLLKERDSNGSGVDESNKLDNRTWNSIGFPGGKTMNETMWRCDQVRAGQLYNRVMFDTREEAEEFMSRMRQMEPDQAISVEEIEARKVWN